MAEHKDSRPSKKESKPPPSKETARLAAETRPLSPKILSPGDLNRLTPEIIVNLQRIQGNRFVQRVIEAKREENEPRMSIGQIAESIQRDRTEESGPSSERAPQVEGGNEFENALAEDNSNLQELIESWSDLELFALRGSRGFLDRMQERLREDQFAYLAAGIMLKYSYVEAARSAAMRILRVQLSNPAVARRMLDRGVQVVIVPRGEMMTQLDEFESLHSEQTFDGRWWAHVRGVGNVRVGGRLYTAITEENLLGGAPDPSVFAGDSDAGVPREPAAGGYGGYSTTTHEFGHAIHIQGLNSEDQGIIRQAYRQKARDTDDPPMLFENHWVDGPRISPTPPASETGYDEATWQEHVAGLRSRQRRRYECYASQNDREYFAQLTNTYLDTNIGVEPTTGQPRNNGRAWIAGHEPREILDLLDRLYHQHTVGPVGGAASGGGSPAGSGPAGGAGSTSGSGSASTGSST